MAKNIVSDNAPPFDNESKTTKLLNAILRGEQVSRKNCENYGIAATNDSIHSIASNLRNKKLIPLITDRKGRGVASYYMNHEEIKRYFSPAERDIQKNEMCIEIVTKRKNKFIKLLIKMIDFEKKQTKPDKHFLNELKTIINQ